LGPMKTAPGEKREVIREGGLSKSYDHKDNETKGGTARLAFWEKKRLPKASQNIQYARTGIQFFQGAVDDWGEKNFPEHEINIY